MEKSDKKLLINKFQLKTYFVNVSYLNIAIQISIFGNI